MIGAGRRILVCRIAEAIETDRLLVVHAAEWLGRLIGRNADSP